MQFGRGWWVVERAGRGVACGPLLYGVRVRSRWRYLFRLTRAQPQVAHELWRLRPRLAGPDRRLPVIQLC